MWILLMSFSFPVLVQFVGRFAPTVRGSLSVATGAQVHLVHLFESLSQVVLKRGHGCTDGRRAKAVSNEAEVGQGALDSRLHDGGRSGVSKWRTVLSEQVSELLADLPESRKPELVRRKAQYLLLSENKSHRKLNLQKLPVIYKEMHHLATPNRCKRYICLYVITVTIRHLLGSKEHVLAGVNLVAFYMWPAQIFSNCLCGELCLTDVAKVSC